MNEDPVRVTYWKHSGYEAEGEAIWVPRTASDTMLMVLGNDDGSAALVIWDPLLNRWQEFDPDVL